MSQTLPIFKREFLGYFRSPVAYVFLAIFHLAIIGLAFFVGNYFKGNVASLQSLFTFFPWIYLFFIPAAGMRLWSEEKRSGNIELIFTLPIRPAEAVLGKFLAGWAFIGIGIAFTLSMAVTTAYLGSPDWGIVASSYLGAFLMAGAYLAICSLASALTENQVISFVVSSVACLVLVFLGWDAFTDILTKLFPVAVVDFVANFSFVPHFLTMTRGLVDMAGVGFFLAITAACLAWNIIALER